MAEVFKILIIDDTEEYSALLKKKLEHTKNFDIYWDEVIQSWADDEPDSIFLRKVQIDRFRKNKIVADTVNDGKEGLKKISKNKYDLIIIDYHMPGLTGSEVFKKIDAVAKNDPLKIILSSNEDAQLVLDMAKEGVEFYVEKGRHEMPSLLSIMATGLYYEHDDYE